jgi:hypothetical protein
LKSELIFDGAGALVAGDAAELTEVTSILASQSEIE